MILNLHISKKSITFAPNLNTGLFSMADFYANYGSKGAKLLGIYRLGYKAVRLHQVSDNKYVLSKDRKILYEFDDKVRAISGFKFEVSCDANEMFNS